ncbi:TPA: Spaf_1101 family AAA-like ATPase [Enterococcus faecium]
MTQVTKVKSSSQIIIPRLYKELSTSENGGRFRKTLFHIHTPASYDYKLIDEETQNLLKIQKNNNWKTFTENDLMKIWNYLEISVSKDHTSEEICKIMPEIFCDIKEFLAYLIVGHTILMEKIEFCLVTDHNTITGFEKLEAAIGILIHERKDYPVKTRLELGIEISCSDKNHIVVILDRRKNNQVRGLSDWLEKNIISSKDGTIRTSLDVFNEINKINAIGYIAHINTSNIFNKDYLSGTYKKQLFNSGLFNIIGVTDIKQIAGTTERLLNFTHQKFNFVIDNDSHHINQLKQNFFYIKGDKLNFSTLQAAFRDFSLSVCYELPRLPDQYIKAIYVEGKEFLKGKDGGYLILKFSSMMNAFIGGRGTGKSTLLNILGFAISQYCETPQDLRKILLQGTCAVVYHYHGQDFYILSHSSDQENNEIFIHNYFNETKNSLRNTEEDEENTRKIAINHRVQVFTYDGKNVEIYRKQNEILKKLLTRKFTVNDLVRVASSDYEITDFVDKILFENKDIRNSSNFYNIGKEFKGSFNKFDKRVSILGKRKCNVRDLLDSYNESQKGKLRILFSQEEIDDQHFNWLDALGVTSYRSSEYFRKYAITYDDLTSYLGWRSEQVGGSIELLRIFYNKDYEILVSDDTSSKFFIDTSHKTTDLELKFLKNKEDILEFHKYLRQRLITPSCEQYAKKFLKNYFNHCEKFTLEFNINNKETTDTRGINYQNINTLSMGQKVVAILSFLLSYSQYIGDYSPFIIDQPEDNLDNQYIYKNLVADLRELKQYRQVILATHNSTIVMNSGCEQVLVMNSDNQKGWCEISGYFSNLQIVNQVINILEGGKSAFTDKIFLYNEKLPKNVSNNISENIKDLSKKNSIVGEIVLKLDELVTDNNLEAIQHFINLE